MERMERKLSVRIDWIFCLCVLVLILLPFFLPYTALATNIVIMSLFATGYNLLLGYTGQLSFGHAAFYGLGAYGTGLLMVHFNTPFWVAIAGGVLAATVGGLFIGLLALRRSTVYFSLLTLAFSQILFFIAMQFREYTGGDDGLLGIPVVRLPFSIDLTVPLHMYYFVLVFFVILAYIARRILNSPFGKAMQAVRENEDRAIFCGYNTQRIKLISFIISGVYAGLAGALFCIHLRFVPLETLHWAMNGEVIFVCIVGGIGTFFGPIVGSAAFIILHDTLQVVFKRWELVVGIVLICFILFFNEGIVGAIESKVSSYRRKRVAESKNGARGGKCA